jgi:mannonate dehydratase
LTAKFVRQQLVELMKLSFLFFGNKPDEKWELCRQMGIDYAIAKLAPEITHMLPPWDYQSLKQSKEIYANNGFDLLGLEGDQFDMNRIKFGLEGREEDAEKYCRMLENMGRLHINLLCYNFMAGIGWYRTDTAIPERGGAFVSGFNWQTSNKQPLTEYGAVAEEKIWENYEWFIKRVMPTAEKWDVKLALHPDDPPVSPLRGIGRIFTNASAIKKALAISDSPSHGLTFCQGTYTTMGEDVKGLIELFGEQQKIFFVHIRDVAGTRENFRETFHDNGPTDMVEMFRIYKAIGFNGPLRSDHVPSMAGDNNEQHGYTIKGNLFGIGYIKGIMEAVGIAT